MKNIDHLIINSPYVEPQRHWKYDRERREFELADGRREAGYIVATPGSQSFDDPGIFYPIELVNKIRPRIAKWKADGYPNATGVTRKLLEHWDDKETRRFPFFYCQKEAIETLIWLSEAPLADKQGIDVPSDGGEFTRYCSKLATGSGKTVVMAMLIAWHVLNKTSYPTNPKYAKDVFVVAPGLTVKQRLQVLNPTDPNNFYDAFGIVPATLKHKMYQARVKIENWHTLNWESEEQVQKKKSVDKRGAKSDEAYVRDVLGEMANASNILVINDEAHHAWRVPAESKVKDYSKEELDATKWVGGLDRINNARGILTCYDFSATPFAPSGKRSSEEALFSWIVSDFGLNDAIESGLVKTPRVVVRDDARPDAHDYKSRFFHIYKDDEVHNDLNRNANPEEPLPQLVSTAYYFLGYDWKRTLDAWKESGMEVPPVMITVANRTETAARVKHMFDTGVIDIEELSKPEKTLHIDSKVLKEAETNADNVDVNFYEIEDLEEVKLTKKEAAELLRQQVDTVGKAGQPGEQVQNVISVGMLSEGWDANTVTHIMGLRAFSSQLLCEQVVGRGLRRVSYDVGENGLLQPEYVNIFGVPFSFLPHEGGEGTEVPPPPPSTKIEPARDKQEYEIKWPNIVRFDTVYKPKLVVDYASVPTLELSAFETPTTADLSPAIAGKPVEEIISNIDLREHIKDLRMQRVLFKTSANLFNQIKPNWKGRADILLAQLIKIVEDFIALNVIRINPPTIEAGHESKKLFLILHMQSIVQHIMDCIRQTNVESRVPVFHIDKPIRSTSEMPTWYTLRPCGNGRKSHINYTVYDSTWEAHEGYQLDQHDNVQSWVKNDRLGFDILYSFKGVVHKYRPDFLIRFKNGDMLILETKGKDSQQNQSKRASAKEWAEAVTNHGGFGNWFHDVSFHPDDLQGILEKYSKASS
ncbi:MAG: BPTD_3080 family restriction endonuclease [Deferribacterales bacterium]